LNEARPSRLVGEGPAVRLLLCQRGKVV
jgi:hypothetical protein